MHAAPAGNDHNFSLGQIALHLRVIHINVLEFHAFGCQRNPDGLATPCT
jgi:hypothetical protein